MQNVSVAASVLCRDWKCSEHSSHLANPCKIMRMQGALLPREGPSLLLAKSLGSQPMSAALCGDAWGACAGAGSTAPKQPQPLAPFCKFMGMQGAQQPWEGPPVVLDGSHGYR